MEVVGGSGCTEVGGDGGERREQDEADGVPHQVPLVVPHGRGQQPAGEGAAVARHKELLLADLARVLVTRGQPLLDTRAVHQTHGPRAGAGRDQLLGVQVALMADPAEHAGGASAAPRRRRLDPSPLAKR